MEKGSSQPDAHIEDLRRGRFIPKDILFRIMFEHIKGLVKEDSGGGSDSYFYAHYNHVVRYIVKRKGVFHDIDLREVMNRLVELGYLSRVGDFEDDEYVINADAFKIIN